MGSEKYLPYSPEAKFFTVAVYTKLFTGSIFYLLIHNFPVTFILRQFLVLPLDQLNTEHRTLILEALRDRLGDLIQDGYQLERILKLSPDQLSPEHRVLILKAVKTKASLARGAEKDRYSKTAILMTIVKQSELAAKLSEDSSVRGMVLS